MDASGAIFVPGEILCADGMGWARCVAGKGYGYMKCMSMHRVCEMWAQVQGNRVGDARVMRSRHKSKAAL